MHMYVFCVLSDFSHRVIYNEVHTVGGGHQGIEVMHIPLAYIFRVYYVSAKLPLEGLQRCVDWFIIPNLKSK